MKEKTKSRKRRRGMQRLEKLPDETDEKAGEEI